MSSDARPLRLRDGLTDLASVGAGRALAGGELRAARAQAKARRETRVAAAALLVLVIGSLVLVVIAANRPSLFSATTHTGFFPGWMAGPLGGLLPWMTRSSRALRYLFSGTVGLMYLAYLFAFAYAPRRLPTRWTIAAVVCANAVYFLAPPMALTDIFNYINYGRMEIVHHLNPYTSIPISEPHSDPSYILSNWHQLLSPYGPLFTLLTFAVVPLGVAASFWALKVLLALASLGTILLVWRCAQLLGRDGKTAIVLVGLNPIVLVWGLGGDHNDFLMVFFIVLGFYLLLLAHSRETAAGANSGGGVRRWLLPPSGIEIGAGAAFVIATAIKASGGVLLPVVLVALLRRPRTLAQVLIGMVLASVLVAALSLMAFGLHIPDLSTQSRLVTNESIPNLLGLAVGAGGESTTIHTLMSGVLALALLGCCWLAWRRRDAITAAGWASVALLLTLSWVLPWYVLWVLPLAALSRSRALRAATVLIGVYLIIAWAPASGLLWNAIDFHPEKTSLGRLHERWVRELLN